MKTKLVILSVLLIATTSCVSEEQQKKHQDITGTWNVFTVDTLENVKYDRSLIKIAVAPNGKLSVIHIDLRPSSLFNFNKSEITYEDQILNYRCPDWGGGEEIFEGKISSNKETIHDVNQARFIIVWERSSDSTDLQLIDYFEEAYNNANRSTYTYNQPVELNDGWKYSTMKKEEIDTDRIKKLIGKILKGKYEDIHNILIIKNGKLVVEEYFREDGKMHSDDINRYYRNRNHLLASSTKSFTSTLIGIALDQGLIKSVGVPVFEFFPEYEYLSTKDKEKILLKHFLTMTAGLEWNDKSTDNPDHIGMWETDDVIRFNLEKPVVAGPGEKFKYSNGLSTCLGAVVTNVSSMPVDVFADNYLFEPLKIYNAEWSKYTDGTFDTDGNLALKPRDFAKIGQLFLDHGKWENEQIVSSEWVTESTKKHVKRTETRSYGYQWWQTDFTVNGRVIESYHTWGWGGQYVFVFPELQLVVSSNAGNFEYKPERYLFEMIEKYIIPAVLSP